jgi:hypothetical protein
MYRIARLFALLFLTSSFAAVLRAQTVPPPTTGLLVQYQYWPVQYVQWLGSEVPYSMIELDVDQTGKNSLYNVVLTERSTGKRILYANTDALIAAAAVQGQEAHKTQIAFDASDAANVGAVSTLRFTLADGRPLQWHFVQGSDVSEQGSGLTPLPQAAIPIFAYREQGAVAGEGTALQIGDAVSTADVWTEISRPPYFVAYRGAMSLGSHTLVLRPGKETWKTASNPLELKVGQTWELEGEQGNHRTLRIMKVEGTRMIIAGNDRFNPASSFTMHCLRGADGWALERVTYAPVVESEKHFFTMQFAAPLSDSSTSGVVDMRVGKKAKLAVANLTFTGSAGDRTQTLQMQNPEWMKGKSMVEERMTSAESTTIVAKPGR